MGKTEHLTDQQIKDLTGANIHLIYPACPMKPFHLFHRGLTPVIHFNLTERTEDTEEGPCCIFRLCRKQKYNLCDLCELCERLYSQFRVHPVKFFEEKECSEFNWGLTPVIHFNLTELAEDTE